MIKEKTIWRASLHNNYIISDRIPFPTSDEMRALYRFIDSDIRDGSEFIMNFIKKWYSSESDSTCFDVTCIDKIEGGKVAIEWPIIENTKPCIILFKDLWSIIETWIELRKQKVPYIILERNGDNYSINGTQTLE